MISTACIASHHIIPTAYMSFTVIGPIYTSYPPKLLHTPDGTTNELKKQKNVYTERVRKRKEYHPRYRP